MTASRSGTETKESSFLRSALELTNPFMSLADFHAWMEEMGKAIRFSVETIPFERLEQWSFDPVTGDLGHASGKFFRVEGVQVHNNIGSVADWEQPIIIQPEIGILGIITRVIDGMRYFLMQAKMEPGNVIPIQLSPTVQATKSNYTQVHQGKIPLYLEYFLDRSRSRVLVDQLQSEQGARFLRKRNRNMILEVDEDLPVHENFCWLTLGQIKELLKMNDLVNMDARSVLSCVPFVDDALRFEYASGDGNCPVQGPLSDIGRDLLLSMMDEVHNAHTTDELVNWFTELKTRCDLRTAYKPMAELKDWVRTDRDIHHTTGEFFSVMAVNVDAEGREVTHWTQPMVAHPHVGLIGYLTQEQNGILHFLVHANAEPGVFDLIEMSPTVSCSAPRRNEEHPGAVPFMERFLEAKAEHVRYDVIQSEEGGRFYQVRNRYMVVNVPTEERLELPDGYIWMTMRQIIDFTKHNNYFNIEARCLLACMGLL